MSADEHASDLALAKACLAGDPAALRTFEGMLAAESRRAAAELRGGATLADEIHSTLRSRLLLADGETPPRLATYAGQAALGRWLGVAATRAGLNLMRRAGRETPLPSSSDLGAAAVLTPDDDPELDVIRRRYRDDFTAAVREAFAAIDTAKDRNLLRLYYFDRLGLDRLAEIYKVNPSTVSRWLTSLRARVFEDTRRRLTARLGDLRDSELRSLVQALGSDLDLTLSRVLAPRS